MDSISEITAFFSLDQPEQDRLTKYGEFFRAWNTKINLVSRTDIDHFFRHHVLHALVIKAWIEWVPGTIIIDAGSGGGLPGLPLAILNPDCLFYLCDSTQKKMKAVDDMVSALGLSNVQTLPVRLESLRLQADFVIARGLAETKQIIQWTRHLLSAKEKNAVPNGWILLKGGAVKQELSDLPKKMYHEMVSVYNFFPIEYYREKYLVYLQK